MSGQKHLWSRPYCNRKAGQGLEAAQDLAKYWRDVLSNRPIYTEFFQYFAQPENDRRTTEFELCEMVLSDVYKQNKELARTLRVSLELLAKLEEDCIIEQSLCIQSPGKRQVRWKMSYKNSGNH